MSQVAVKVMKDCDYVCLDIFVLVFRDKHTKTAVQVAHETKTIKLQCSCSKSAVEAARIGQKSLAAMSNGTAKPRRP